MKLIFCLGIFLASASLTGAFFKYQKAIPNGNRVFDVCSERRWPGVGHLVSGGGGDRNPFGLDFAANNFKWTKKLCRMDSDGDNISNGEELGDPECVWKRKKTPSRTTKITHPGFSNNCTGNLG